MASESKPRLTRQRKLRHISELELGFRPSQFYRWSNDANSPSPTTRFAAAVPQPLPLPDLNSLFKYGDHRSRSPREGRSGGGDGDGDGREGHPLISSMGSDTGHQKDVAAKSPKSSTYRQRGLHQDLNGESFLQNFRLNVPVRSSPTSRLSSPVLSPQRFSTVDLFHSSVMVPREFQTSSALEFPAWDRLAGSSQSPPRRTTQSPEYSPFHCPTLQSPCCNARNPTRAALHSHHKSLPENSTARHECNSPANVHPLPLPPGVSKPLHSITIRHSKEKPEESLLKSQWQKGKLIGRGTFGSVYLATNCVTGALCAMKEVDLIPDDPKSAECIKQLDQEIKILQHRKHPNIVQYYGSEIIEDRFCIYLEYVCPGSINKYVREHCGAVTESVVRNFTRHILLGLAYLHSTKTIHRDIKGANLLVDSSGVVKLADFGLAKHLTGNATELSLKGSPHWMAPEVLQAVMRKDGKSELAFAVDIWSVGCTVLEMLNGKPPWSEFSGVQAMFNVLNKSPPIPETLSSEGKDFLRWCFQRNPADRPSAVKLLDHAFVRNSCRQNVSVSVQEFSGMKLIDTPHSPRDRTTRINDLTPLSLGTQNRHGKLPCSGECCVHSYFETSEVATTPRYSPRSTLEVFPNASSPELNCSPHNTSPSRNISNGLLGGAGNNHPYVFSSPRGRNSHTSERW